MADSRGKTLPPAEKKKLREQMKEVEEQERKHAGRWVPLAPGCGG